MQTSMTPQPLANSGPSQAMPTPPSLKPVTDAVAQETAHLGDMAKHLWTQGTERAKHAVEQVQHEAATVNQRTQHYVQERPLTSLLIAVAAGAAIAGVLSLAFRRSH